MANGNNPIGRARGKGGNIDTRKNPFNQLRLVRSAPNLTEVALLTSTLQKVLCAGHAVMLGHTRDGGALVLTILEGDNRHRTYCTSEHELEEAITSINAMFETD